MTYLQSSVETRWRTVRLLRERRARVFDASEQRGFAVKFGFAAVVIVAAWAGLFATTASAAPVPVASLNAESMTLPRGAAAIRDRNADGGRAVEFDRNGGATASLTTARGTQCRSTWPQVQLAIDGAVVLNVAANKTAWTAFAATGLTIPAGTHSIVLTLSNVQDSRCDRAAYIDILRLSGRRPRPRRRRRRRLHRRRLQTARASSSRPTSIPARRCSGIAPLRRPAVSHSWSRIRITDPGRH